MSQVNMRGRPMLTAMHSPEANKERFLPAQNRAFYESFSCAWLLMRMVRQGAAPRVPATSHGMCARMCAAVCAHPVVTGAAHCTAALAMETHAHTRACMQLVRHVPRPP